MKFKIAIVVLLVIAAIIPYLLELTILKPDKNWTKPYSIKPNEQQKVKSGDLQNSEGNLQRSGYNIKNVNTLNKKNIPKYWWDFNNNYRYKAIYKIITQDWYRDGMMPFSHEVHILDLGFTGEIRYTHINTASNWSWHLDKSNQPNADDFANWTMNWQVKTKDYEISIKDQEFDGFWEREVIFNVFKGQKLCPKNNMITSTQHFRRYKSHEQAVSVNPISEDGKFWQRVVMDANLESEKNYNLCRSFEITYHKDPQIRKIPIPDKSDEW